MFPHCLSIIVILFGLIAHGYSNKVSLCVERQVDLNKCNAMNSAAKANNLNTEFECQLDDLNGCLVKISNDLLDAIIVDGHSYADAKKQKLIPILYEIFGDDNVMVAVADTDLTASQIKDAPLEFDEKVRRELHAAMLLNHRRGNPVCGGLKAGTTNTIKILKSTKLKDNEYTNMKLICSNLERQPLTEYKTCNIEADLVNAIFVKESDRKTQIADAFKVMIDNFGPNGKHKSDFEMFAFFKDSDFDGTDVIFTDDAIDLRNQPELPNGINEEKFNEIHCHADHH